ncbi:GNAT family N-acetyltransferase [Pseudooceanicola nanhaiensis]|uniref:GNAT family N-acetyltransferase n=1 Tax=Pseudooceanicola nanhaiensis TaxID=375761 RepID=UPI001CD4C27E|nr:GNAT family N-acetyltransferase [Pseudooceanicola nanhaiensis]MCA0920247.1 GNAT family N-acetyltransferase [Pseudooceanicola nanhaiensis]
MIHVRRAGPLDTGAMAELLNEIIAKGGTTALTRPVSRAMLAEWMTGSDRAAWHLAEDDAGELLGFQWIDPLPETPDVAHIATFARVGRTGLGIGSALFEATRRAAKDLAYHAIDAEIRADNAGGLAYYQSRGFEDHHRIRDRLLDDGTRIDKIVKRYEV